MNCWDLMHENRVLHVVANKIDNEQRIQVMQEDGQAFAMGIGFEFCEVSALQSRNIDKPFKILANIYY